MQKLCRPIVFAAAGVAVVAMTGCGKSEKDKKADAAKAAVKAGASPKAFEGLKQHDRTKTASRDQPDAANAAKFAAHADAIAEKLQARLNAMEDKLGKYLESGDPEMDAKLKAFENSLEQITKSTSTTATEKHVDEKLDALVEKFQEQITQALGDDGGFMSKVTNMFSTTEKSVKDLQTELKEAKKNFADSEREMKTFQAEAEKTMHDLQQQDAGEDKIKELMAQLQPVMQQLATKLQESEAKQKAAIEALENKIDQDRLQRQPQQQPQQQQPPVVPPGEVPVEEPAGPE